MLSIVIFGGTGDLARKKLFKSLYNLYAKGLLPQNTKVIGFARRDLNTDSYRQFVADELPDELDLKAEFLECFYYFQGDLHNERSYEDLRAFLVEMDEQYKICASKLFYMSVRPELYADVFTLLKKTNVLNTCNADDGAAWSRLLIEKPFGTNFEHAKFLDERLGEVVSEDRIFRIDHYLAKEALENILVFRFKNAMFNTIWSKDFISKISIKLFEKRGVEGRGEFYDQVGALRDVGQNHALQMLALVLMNKPVEFNGAHIRFEREKVLATLRPLEYVPEHFERAQYAAYAEHANVMGSDTESYFKITLGSDMSQWQGVPCEIESGKAMEEDKTEIRIEFVDGNMMCFEIQPEARITFTFNVKETGYDYRTNSKNFSFSYKEHEMFILDAYEKILYQAIAGDVTSFVSTREVLEQWRIIDDILSHWKTLPLKTY
jgi:glucose-6-phosphate 1-dehydrogenase